MCVVLPQALWFNLRTVRMMISGSGMRMFASSGRTSSMTCCTNMIYICDICTWVVVNVIYNTHLSPFHAVHDSFNAHQHILYYLRIGNVLLEYHFHLGQDHSANRKLIDAIKHIGHSHHGSALSLENNEGLICFRYYNIF